MSEDIRNTMDFVDIGKDLGKNMSKIKSTSVFLGVIYAFVFLYTLPILSQQGYSLDDKVLITLVFVITTIVVHIALNGLFCATGSRTFIGYSLWNFEC